MGGSYPQVSLYSLHQESLRTAIDIALAIFCPYKLERKVCRCGKWERKRDL